LVVEPPLELRCNAAGMKTIEERTGVQGDGIRISTFCGRALELGSVAAAGRRAHADFPVPASGQDVSPQLLPQRVQRLAQGVASGFVRRLRPKECEQRITARQTIGASQQKVRE